MTGHKSRHHTGTFVIAQVLHHGESTPKYRCLAAYDNIRDSGRLPLKGTRRFLTLVKQRHNAKIIRSELRNVQGKFGRLGNEPGMPLTPIPYTTFLLSMSCKVDLEDPKNSYIVSGASFFEDIEHPDTSPHPHSYSKGVTIYDITDPSSPAYCFMHFDQDKGTDIPANTPISARTYVRLYHHEPASTEHLDNEAANIEKDVLECITALDREKMVKAHMLLDAWPEDFTYTLDDQPSELEEALKHHEQEVEAAIRSAVREALDNDDTTEFEKFVWMPENVEIIQSVLREEDPFPDTGLHLLADFVADDGLSDKVIWDLSSYHLTSKQILRVVRNSKDIQELNLSDNPNITYDTIREVLQTIRHLQILIVLDCPGLSDEDIYALLVNEPHLMYDLEALVHPVLLQASQEALYLNQFSFITVMKDTDYEISVCSLSLFTPAIIVQALTDLLGAVAEMAMDDADHILDGSLVLQAAFSAAARDDGQRWSERRVVSFPQACKGAVSGRGWVFICDFSAPKIDNRYPGSTFAYGFLRFPDGEGRRGGRRKRAQEAEVDSDYTSSDSSEDDEGKKGYEGRPQEAEVDDAEYSSDDSHGDITEKKWYKERPQEAGVQGVKSSLNDSAELSDIEEMSSSQPSCHVHSLEGFLHNVTAEGRPPPSKSAVVNLENILEALKEQNIAHPMEPSDMVRLYSIVAARYRDKQQ